MEENNGIDVDSLAARKEDQLILYHAMLGHDITETYSNARLKMAGDRHIVGTLWAPISVRCSVLRGLRRYASNMD